METSAGEPLISVRPFAGTKWSASLMSKESPCLSGSLSSYTKAGTISCCTPCRRLLTDSTQNTLVLQKPSVPNIVGRQNKRAGMSAYGQCGVQRVASEPPRAPGYYSIYFKPCVSNLPFYISSSVHTPNL